MFDYDRSLNDLEKFYNKLNECSHLKTNDQNILKEPKELDEVQKNLQRNSIIKAFIQRNLLFSDELIGINKK